MCDFPNSSHPNHNCYQFPQLKIVPCELCGKMTCGWSRVACVIDTNTISSWTACTACANRCNTDPNFRQRYIAMIASHHSEPVKETKIVSWPSSNSDNRIIVD